MGPAIIAGAATVLCAALALIGKVTLALLRPRTEMGDELEKCWERRRECEQRCSDMEAQIRSLRRRRQVDDE